MTPFAVLSTEILKLKRSRVLWVAAIAPAFVVLAVTLLMLGFGGRRPRPLPWEVVMAFAPQLWAFFMLPLSVTLICLITAQVEHAAKAWNYVLATPVARWRIFSAKVLIVLALTAGMSALFYLLLPLSEPLRGLFGKEMSGTYDWRTAAVMLAKVWAGAILLIAIQLWAALRFRTVAVPLGVGIAGGFIGAVAIVGSQIVKTTDTPFRFFPWLIPVETLQKDPLLAQTIWLGSVGGVVALVALVIHLSRREAA